MRTFKTTEEIEVPKKLIDQIIGQNKAVGIIKKAATQKRHVLLIGPPGTGKSMLAQAMAELMPSEKAEDMLAYPNPDNENEPRIRVVKTYPDYAYLKKHADLLRYYSLQERAMIKKYTDEDRADQLPMILKMGLGRRLGRSQRTDREGGPAPSTTLLFLLGIIVLGIVLFAEMEENVKWLIVAIALGMGFLLVLSNATAGLSRRLNPVDQGHPKLIVDNTGKKTAPFIDATGSRAGALLGDCKHDPLQTIFSHTTVYKKGGEKVTPALLCDIVDELMRKYPERIERNDNDYEGMVLPDGEQIYVLGSKDGQIKPVRIFCVNRRMYEGKMHAVRHENNRVVVTPEHKVYVDGTYMESKYLRGGEKLTQHFEPIIAKEEIICTFSKQDQKDAQNYYKFVEIKEKNPSFGYKRIAKMLGIKPGQTRWWNNKKQKPKAIRTVERLEGMGLLPFTFDNKSAPAAARILGTTFGDGGVFSTLNGIFLSSSEESSLQEYAQDMIAIFGEGIGKNFERRISGINNTGMVIWNTHRDVIRFFLALGSPLGRKNKEIRIPAWIYLNEEIQKEFFGAFLGNELCSPKFLEKNLQIDEFAIALAGRYELKENRLEILRAVSRYLNSYGVKTSKSIYENEFREGSWVWKLSISKEIENVMRFSYFIPVRYSRNKETRIKEAIARTLQHKVESSTKMESTQKSERYVLSTLRVSRDLLQKIRQKQKWDFDDRIIEFSGRIYNVTTESGNLFANGILVSNSGGLGTPAHLRVESGAIHRSNKGVLFIDEIASLRLNWQQELLTAMQEKRYAITGQSEMSSGALVKTEPAPSDFILVAAGNLPDLQRLHPALRSRIRGNGYEVYVEDSMEDNEQNVDMVVQFVAQEVQKDTKIPHFGRDAVEEIVEEARRLSNRRKRFSLNLRELGGLIRAAGDIARGKKKTYVEQGDVIEARKIFHPIEGQLGKKIIEIKKEYQTIITHGAQVGRVNGLAVLGESMAGLVLPIVAEVTPAASKAEGKVIATGKLGIIAKEAVENVSAIVKKHIGVEISRRDIHIQFLQTYEGVEGDSASISIAVGVLSALADIPVHQEVGMTGSIDVRGDVLPVGGVTAKIEAAIESGLEKVIIPQANKEDVYLSKERRKKIMIVPVHNIVEVLREVLKDSAKKRTLIKKIRKQFRE